MPVRQPETMPVELFLADYAPPLVAIAERLRAIVTDTVPDAIERVRVGWRLIGYDLPGRRNGAIFAWVWLEPEHVHLGFPYGVHMADPAGVMNGAGVTKLARWLTYAPGDMIDVAVAAGLVEEAARTRVIPRSLR